MTAASPPHRPPEWNRALACAGAGHGLVLAAILLWTSHAPHPVPDPVMEIELPPLPPGAVAAQAVHTPAVAQPSGAHAENVDAPPVAAPLPADALTVPPKPLAPVAPVAAPAMQAAPIAPAAAAPAPVAAPAAPSIAQAATAHPSIGDDPRARKAEANYYQTLMAYLARAKDYPVEARQARQQGVVRVRFTIDAHGTISGEVIKTSSGYALLDNATLALLRRVSPVPPLPRELGRDSVTIALPIEYSLSSK